MSIDLDEIEKIIKSHLEDQPYEIKCSECGSELEIAARVDGFLDIYIGVHPCGCA